MKQWLLTLDMKNVTMVMMHSLHLLLYLLLLLMMMTYNNKLTRLLTLTLGRPEIAALVSVRQVRRCLTPSLLLLLLLQDGWWGTWNRRL